MKGQVYLGILGDIGCLLPGLAAPWAFCSPFSTTAPVSAYTHIHTQECITTGLNTIEPSKASKMKILNPTHLTHTLLIAAASEWTMT